MIFWYQAMAAREPAEIPLELRRFMAYAQFVNVDGLTHKQAMERLG